MTQTRLSASRGRLPFSRHPMQSQRWHEKEDFAAKLFHLTSDSSERISEASPRQKVPKFFEKVLTQFRVSR
jgi:hypothetical protein